MNKKVHKITGPLKGHIQLAGSKSISNRLLIIRALCETDFEIADLANADDTQLLKEVLGQSDSTYDVHHAGTSYRFLCSYLSLKEGEQILTGSSRMKERPIGPLVDALRDLGANIEYLEEEGFPPLKISNSHWKKLEDTLKIDATVSSQFISSLLLVAPCLPYGLRLELVGDLVSRPYLEMTLKIMENFGISYDWTGQVITILPQKYQPKDTVVEADWSAASYYFGLVALVPGSTITLGGLQEYSLQGDAAIVDIMKQLGVDAHFDDGIWHLKHTGDLVITLEQDFLLQPDLAQTVSVTCAGLKMTALFSGLQTLKVKETDRIAALQTELAKVQVWLSKLPAKFSKNKSLEYYMQDGAIHTEDIPVFATYRDHRMAMSLAMLASKMDVIIEDAMVVSKSYPAFWEDLESIGIRISD